MGTEENGQTAGHVMEAEFAGFVMGGAVTDVIMMDIAAIAMATVQNGMIAHIALELEEITTHVTHAMDMAENGKHAIPVLAGGLFGMIVSPAAKQA